MKNITVRAISGAVYVALITGSILAGAPWFFALMSLFTVFGVIEIDKMASHKLSIVSTVLDIVITLCLVSFGYFIYSVDGMFKWVLLIAILPLLLSRFIWALWDRRDDAFRCVAGSMLAIFYIGVPMMLFNLLYASFSQWSALTLFVLIWCNDTGAYLFGSRFGKHRLFERLSPKKSWEGFFGGLLCCVAVGLGCYFINKGHEDGLLLPLWLWVVYAVIVCISATLGDLFESLLKRSAHVKDSGNIIPGHGGILDRIDSLLFVVPISLIFFLIVSFCGEGL